MMFKDLLLKANLTQAELARRLGLQPPSISNWKGDPPGYAIAYLELLIKFNQCKHALDYERSLNEGEGF